MKLIHNDELSDMLSTATEMELASMSAADAATQLAHIHQREEQRLLEQGNGKAQIAFARDVKNSLLFQYNWGDLLSAAPLALSLMGSCYVAATSPLAHSISLGDAMPNGGFKYIKYPFLKACLVQVSDAGRMAFIRAETNMNLINQTSVSLGGYMNSISQYLPALPDPAARDALINKLQLLKDGSDDCLRYAQGIEEEFRNWLLLVCELHQVTVAKEGRTAEAQEQSETNIGCLNIEAELKETVLKSNEAMAQKLKENLDSDKKLFEKAANELPGPWESIALTLVDNLATQATTAISQVMSMMLDIGGAASKAIKGRLHVLPADSTDPAYRVSITVSTLINTLATLLGAETNEDIDWDGLKEKPDEKKGLAYLRIHLQYHRDDLHTDTAPSRELKKAIEMSLDVIEKIEGVLKKDKELMSSRPLREEIDKWRGDVKEARALVIKLSTTARNFAGGAGTAPNVNSKGTSGQSADRTDKLSALNVAVEKMNTTQAAYSATQDNYVKACDKTAEVGFQLARIKANLKSLTEQKITMDGIKKILIQCIGTLIQMKTQITNLVRFFSALSAMVEHVVKRNVVDFVQQVGSSQRLLIGNVSLLDISRQELYTTSLMCQAYFSLFSTVAKMYTKISIEHIMPGVQLCNELSMSADENPNAFAQRTRALDEFSDNAQRGVQELIFKSQREIAATLDARVKLVAKDTEVLPKLPPAIVNAITDGRETITTAVSQGLGEYQAPAVIADYSMDPDEI